MPAGQPIFISYSFRDVETASRVVRSLEKDGMTCWMAPRDILPGSSWPAEIVKAIQKSRALVLIFSDHSNASRHVAREIVLADDYQVPVVPLKIQNAKPAPVLSYYLRGAQILNACSGSLDVHLDVLRSALAGDLGQARVVLTGPSDTHLPPVVRPDQAWREARAGSAADIENYIARCPADLFVESAVVELARSIDQRLWQAVAGEDDAESRYLDAIQAMDVHPDARVRGELLALANARGREAVSQILGSNETYPVKSLSELRRALNWPAGRRNAAIVEGWQKRTGFKCSKLMHMLPASGFDVHDRAVSGLAIDSLAERVVTASQDGTIRQWALNSGRPLSLFRAPAAVTSAALSSDHRTLAIGSRNGKIWLVNLDSGVFFGEFARHAGEVTALCFAPDGRTLLSGGNDNRLLCWTISSSSPRPLSAHSGCLMGLAVSLNGQWAVSGGADRKLCLWNLHASRIEKTIQHNHAVASCVFSHDSDSVIFSSLGGAVFQWDWARNSVRQLGLAGTAPVHQVLTSIDDRWICSSSRSQPFVFLFDERNQRVKKLANTAAIERFAISHDSVRMASVTRDHVLRLWTLENGEPAWETVAPPWSDPLAVSFDRSAQSWTLLDRLGAWWSGGDDSKPVHQGTMPAQGAQVRRVAALAEGGAAIVACSGASTVSLRYANEWRPMRVKRSLDQTPYVAISRDGELAALVSNNTIECFGLSATVPLRTFTINGRAITRLCISSSAEHARPVVVAVTPDELHAWNPYIGSTCHPPVRLRSEVVALDAAGDGGAIIVALANGSIGSWNPLEQNWRLVDMPGASHAERRCTSLISHPDGRWLFSGHENGDIRVWSTESWTCVHAMTAHRLSVKHLTIDKTGRRLLSTGLDGSLKVWHLLWDDLPG